MLPTDGPTITRRARSAIRNHLKGRQYCNPPQSAIRHAKHSKRLHAFGSGTARAQERSQNWSPKLPRGAFRAASRLDYEFADESRDRG
eukprot:10899339-Alexandrium_andersonii.AAC.1